MSKQQIGVVGMAVMGKNLALNIESRGYSVALFNRTGAKTTAVVEEHPDKNFKATYTIEEFVESIEKPRRILLMVKAGPATDATIQELLPHLDKGDILIDGGNTFFKDTMRRNEELANSGINFIGTGVSGGEEGALKGPSIMPGGQKEAYALVAPILEQISAKAEDGAPCVTYIGPNGAGHYVKMVHNGIEYGDMQLIAESYDLMKNILNLSVEEMVQLVKEKYDSIDKNARQPISERLYGLLTELQEQKRSQKLLEFNDVLQNLKSALENEEIQHYIGQKYDYLFIDEFQDTNPLQWEIVKRMTKENRIKLIVVGDDDQSIYGFRGSEPAYIKNFEKEYPTKTLFLLTNYRSRAAIVQGANRLISYNKNDRIPKAMIPAQKEAGVMEAYLFSDTKAESQWLIKQIQTFIQKNGKYKESIILYRSASQTQQLVQSLLKTNIPFVLEADSPYEGIFGIKSFQHFYQKIVHWQTALNLQKKNQAYQQLLRQLMADCYLKKSECDQYFSPKYQNIAVADYILSISPNLKSKSAEIREFEEALRKTDQHQEIYSLVQSYLHLPRIAKEIDQSDQEWIREEVKQHATFRRLQALSQETQATAKELKTRLIAYRQGKLDALCIQSIHKSKGLSYRNVFLIGCNEGSLPYNGATEKKVIDFNEIKAEPVTTIEEERRLFYVAMTRARNRLYLCVPQMKNSRKLKVSRFIKETGSRVKKGK